jgi:hypothetical protein
VLVRGERKDGKRRGGREREGKEGGRRVICFGDAAEILRIKIRKEGKGRERKER